MTLPLLDVNVNGPLKFGWLAVTVAVCPTVVRGPDKLTLIAPGVVVAVGTGAGVAVGTGVGAVIVALTLGALGAELPPPPPPHATKAPTKNTEANADKAGRKPI